MLVHWHILTDIFMLLAIIIEQGFDDDFRNPQFSGNEWDKHFK